MKFFITLVFLITLYPSTHPVERKEISRAALLDKIRGSWAGQYFGTTIYQAPPVFASRDSSYTSSQANLNQLYTNNSVDAASHLFGDLLYIAALNDSQGNFEDTLSQRISSADFVTGHSMQTAGYNLRGGMNPGLSGRWINNPHAEDPDFARAADPLGLIFPGMARSLLKVTEGIGHMTNTGEGYYGGLYIATLNSLAFVYQSPREIVQNAILSLPEKSDFRKCLEEVVVRSTQKPREWTANWKYISKEWKKHSGCPFNPSAPESDARIYSAFITMLFLSGDGDLNKTLRIASDFPNSNHVLPAVLGLIGVVNGFEKFSDDWKTLFDSIADLPLHESLPTLNEAIDMSEKLALRSIEANGGKEKKDGELVIRLQRPSAHGFERGFDGHFIARVQPLNVQIENQFEFDFEGVGFVLHADQSADLKKQDIAFAELYLNNKYIDRIAIPNNKSHSASDLCWRLQLPHRKYRAKIKLLKPADAPSLTVTNLVVYDVMPPVSVR